MGQKHKIIGQQARKWDPAELSQSFRSRAESKKHPDMLNTRWTGPDRTGPDLRDWGSGSRQGHLDKKPVWLLKKGLCGNNHLRTEGRLKPFTETKNTLIHVSNSQIQSSHVRATRWNGRQDITQHRRGLEMTKIRTKTRQMLEVPILSEASSTEGTEHRRR